MYEADILRQFIKMPLFTLGDVNQIINNRSYAKIFLDRMVKRGRIFRIKKNFYTLHDDPFLVCTFLTKPSYISSVSALSYHRLITQIPNEVFCATTKRAASIYFLRRINMFHVNHLFGFKMEEYDGFRIPIADPERAIIDSFSIVPVGLVQEAFNEIDKDKMIEYIKRIKKSSLAKRVGYLLEHSGYDAYKELKGFINYKYVSLDPLISRTGRKDKKWRLMVNSK